MNVLKLSAGLIFFMIGTSAKAEAQITVLEGYVVSLLGVGAFVLSDSRNRTVVYYRDMKTSKMAPGDHLRVIGTPVDDWMGMSETEIQAQRVEWIIEEATAQSP